MPQVAGCTELDAFLLAAKDAELSKHALELKRAIVKKRAAA